MKGRRLPVVDGQPTMPTEPGDYCGPVTGFIGGEVPIVLFLKPNARDEGVPARARSVQHVASPPHTFTEEDDGTLTISASISNLTVNDKNGETDDGWHGYLERGVWRQV